MREQPLTPSFLHSHFSFSKAAAIAPILSNSHSLIYLRPYLRGRQSPPNLPISGDLCQMANHQQPYTISISLAFPSLSVFLLLAARKINRQEHPPDPVGKTPDLVENKLGLHIFPLILLSNF